jgi:death-on-curing protein
LPNEPRWLPAEIIVQINLREVAETGEPFGLLSPHLLESAAAKPKALWHYESQEDMAALATSLLFAITRNHPFRQGNKRTGFTAAEVFLSLNGYELMAPDSGLLAEAILDVITGAASEEEFVEVMRLYVRPVEH